MSLIDWSDKTVGDYTTHEEEPYALTIVVRLERDNLPSDLSVKKAVAGAIARFFDNEKSSPNGEWYPAIEKWLNGRIRKVTRRARGSEWNKLLELDGFLYQENDVQIFILPPHPNNEPPSLVKKLQVSGLDLEKQPPEEKALSHNTMFIAFNPELEMTTGKASAQVGHAVQLAIFKNTPHVPERWKNNGYPVAFVSWDAINEIMHQTMTPVIDVYDAGFTEVESGSHTVRAILVC